MVTKVTHRQTHRNGQTPSTCEIWQICLIKTYVDDLSHYRTFLHVAVLGKRFTVVEEGMIAENPLNNASPLDGRLKLERARTRSNIARLHVVIDCRQVDQRWTFNAGTEELHL